MSQRTIFTKRTTRAERLLLLIATAVVPLQSEIPAVKGFSVAFIMFLFLSGYILVRRFTVLKRTLRHPVFLAGFGLVAVALVGELAHQSGGIYEAIRIGFMILGAVLIASLCRDRKAFLFAAYGSILAGFGLALILIFSTYGHLQSATVNNFKEASHLRVDALSSSELEGDLNTIGFFIAQAAVLALALSLSMPSRMQRYVYLVLGTICLIGSMLPMSRGASLILFISCAGVLYGRGILRPGVLIASCLIVITTWAFVPDVVFQRFTVSTEIRQENEQDGRVRVYTAVVENLPSYFLTGVGVKNYWGKWGERTGFRKSNGQVSGTHNVFAQVTVFWGVAGLLALLALVWQAYRCFPSHRLIDKTIYLCILGISVSTFLESMVVHVIAGKQFSFGLGMLVGGSQWMWSSHVKQRVRKKKAMPFRTSSFGMQESNQRMKERHTT